MLTPPGAQAGPSPALTPPLGQPPRDDGAARTLAVQALLAEHQFVSSLISMYREFQMRAVGFAMVLYAAVLGLIGSAIDTTSALAKVVEYVAELICYPAAMIILVFAVMEVRIIRASLYVAKRIAPTLDAILAEVPQARHGLLRWERSPGIYLGPGMKRLASSLMFVLAIATPAAASAIWHISTAESGRWSSWVTWPWHDLCGLLTLLGATTLAGAISGSHEGRLPLPAFMHRRQAASHSSQLP